jgi:hypothetical protein
MRSNNIYFIDDDEYGEMLYHSVFNRAHKYIDRKWIHGKWRYYYKKALKRFDKKGALNSISEGASATYLATTKAKPNRHSYKSLKEQARLQKVKERRNAINAWLNVKRKGVIEDPPNPIKEYKYIKKVKMANGKVRYFYDEFEFVRWVEADPANRNPRFTDTYDRNNRKVVDEEIAKVNPNYKKHTYAYTNNCATCTLAWIMRRHGYDVTSTSQSVLDNHDKYDIQYRNEIIGWYHPELVIPEKDSKGHVKKHTEGFGTVDVYRENVEEMSEKLGKDPSYTVDKPNKEDYMKTKGIFKKRKVLDEKKYNAAKAEYDTYVKVKEAGFVTLNMEPELNKKIKENGGTLTDQMKFEATNTMEKRLTDYVESQPEGAYGNINVNWYGGGAHSMVWERMDDGSVRILDTQTGDIYESESEVRSVLKYVYEFDVIRADNAKISYSDAVPRVSPVSESDDVSKHNAEARRLNS